MQMRLIKFSLFFLYFVFFAVVYNGLLWIFGGFNGILDLHFNDLHCFDPIRNIWQNIETHGTKPKIRRRQSCVVIGSKMFLFGGTWWVIFKTALTLFFEYFLNHRRETVINQSSTLSTVNQTDDCLLNKIMWFTYDETTTATVKKKVKVEWDHIEFTLTAFVNEMIHIFIVMAVLIEIC